MKATFLMLLYINPIVESKFDYLRKTLALETFIDNPNKSFVVSPLLVRFPLCKLAAHAQGYAKNEILSVLGLKSETALQDCFKSFSNVMTATKDMDLSMLNKIIVNYTSDIRSTFISNSTNYGVKVDQIGFNYPKLAVSFVNRWVDRASIKRISDILDMGDIDNKTSILIVNAAYLKVTWEFPFDIRSTKNVKFHHHDGNISMVPMMKRTDTYLYLSDSITGAMFVNMKLACKGLSITIAVPNTPKALMKLVYQLSSQPDTLQGVYNRMQYEQVSVMLPRFKVKTGVEWNKYLRKMLVIITGNDSLTCSPIHGGNVNAQLRAPNSVTHPVTDLGQHLLNNSNRLICDIATKPLILHVLCKSQIGLLKVFNETNSGLNGILTDNSQIQNMYLSKVKQKNFIDVDEMGVYRQKIDDDRDIFHGPYQPLRTNRGLSEHNGPLVMADHPFLFIVSMKKGDSNHLDLHDLFAGVYYGPGY